MRPQEILLLLSITFHLASFWRFSPFLCCCVNPISNDNLLQLFFYHFYSIPLKYPLVRYTDQCFSFFNKNRCEIVVNHSFISVFYITTRSYRLIVIYMDSTLNKFWCIQMRVIIHRLIFIDTFCLNFPKNM